MSNVINIDDITVETIDDVTPVHVVTLHGIHLLTSDIALLESQHGWLNQKIINVGQKMLQVKFPETEGLADVGCADTLTYCGKPEAANPVFRGGLEGTKGRGDISEAVTPCSTRARGRY